MFSKKMFIFINRLLEVSLENTPRKNSLTISQYYNYFLDILIKRSQVIKNQCKYVVRCAICYHLYNLKNIKNTHGGVLILVKLRHRCDNILVSIYFNTISAEAKRIEAVLKTVL